MLHHKIMEILLSLHEKATGPLQRVYELCLENMENVEGEIKSLAELPQIPFTNPIKRKIQEALGPETEPETNSPKKSKKRAKKPVSEAESSTSTTFPRKKRSKKATKRYMDSSSSSNNSSASSLPDPSEHRVKCTQCESWVEKYEMRQHKRGHQTDVTTSLQEGPRKTVIKCQILYITDNFSMGHDRKAVGRKIYVQLN